MSAAPEGGGNYSAEDVAQVQRVQAASSFYAVLQVEQSVTGAQLKKAYRKMAMRVHPDKNRAPGADDAFKTVSQAFSTLDDAGKRSIYDQVGHEAYVSG